MLVGSLTAPELVNLLLASRPFLRAGYSQLYKEDTGGRGAPTCAGVAGIVRILAPGTQSYSRVRKLMHDGTLICVKSVGPKFINSMVLAILQDVVGVSQGEIAVAKSDRLYNA